MGTLAPAKYPPASAIPSSTESAVFRRMLSEMRTELDRLHEIGEEFARARRTLLPRKAEDQPAAPLQKRPHRTAKINEIAAMVSAEMDVPLEYFFNARHYHKAARARRVLWTLAYALTGLSAAEIARRTERHHTTVHYGLERLKREMLEDPGLNRLVKNMMARLRGDSAEPRPRRTITLEEIIAAVAAEFRVAVEEIFAVRYGYRSGRMRAVIALIARRCSANTYADVDRHFGTDQRVRKEVEYLRRAMRSDGELEKRVLAIEARLIEAAERSVTA